MIARERSLTWLACLVLVAGGVLGGGPTSANWSMLVELLTMPLAAIAIAGLVGGDYPRQAKPALILLLLICIVPLVQLVPLPAALLSGLPGRTVPNEILALLGGGSSARPFSLTPEETRLAALSLIVPAAIFVATLQIGPESRDQFLMALVAFAFVSAVLGVFQVAAGGGIEFGIYPQVHEGYPVGFFANRNHEGNLLLIALPASIHLIRRMRVQRDVRRMVAAIAVLFFALAVISTQSRSAFTLLPVALAGGLVVWIGDVRDRRIWIGLAALIVASAVGYVLLMLTPVGGHLGHRFTTVGEDLRPQIWQGSKEAISAFWPFGSGVGSFVPIYNMFEDLNSVSFAWVNHAHNDYIEILLETGIFGATLLACYLVIFVLALCQEVPENIRGQRYTGLFMVLILLAHSLTDYPLRTFSLLAVFAFSNGILFQPRKMVIHSRRTSRVVTPPPAFAMDLNDATPVRR